MRRMAVILSVWMVLGLLGCGKKEPPPRFSNLEVKFSEGETELCQGAGCLEIDPRPDEMEVENEWFGKDEKSFKIRPLKGQSLQALMGEMEAEILQGAAYKAVRDRVERKYQLEVAQYRLEITDEKLAVYSSGDLLFLGRLEEDVEQNMARRKKKTTVVVSRPSSKVHGKAAPASGSRKPATAASAPTVSKSTPPPVPKSAPGMQTPPPKPRSFSDKVKAKVGTGGRMSVGTSSTRDRTGLNVVKAEQSFADKVKQSRGRKKVSKIQKYDSGYGKKFTSGFSSGSSGSSRRSTSTSSSTSKSRTQKR